MLHDVVTSYIAKFYASTIGLLQLNGFSRLLMITNSYHIETAEGIDIEIVPAGLAARTYAFFLDLCIRIVLFIAAALIVNYFGTFGQGLLLIILFMIEWFYPVLFEIYKGATPGKKAFGLKVVYDNGLPISFAGSLTRNLFRFIDFLPFFYVIGAITMVLSKESKRIGDIVAGTTVIYQPEKAKPLFFNFDKESVTLPIMNTEQQRLIISFAHRARYLSEARQIELADTLFPILGVRGEEAIRQIRIIAAVLVGKA